MNIILYFSRVGSRYYHTWRADGIGRAGTHVWSLTNNRPGWERYDRQNKDSGEILWFQQFQLKWLKCLNWYPIEKLYIYSEPQSESKDVKFNCGRILFNMQWLRCGATHAYQWTQWMAGVWHQWLVYHLQPHRPLWSHTWQGSLWRDEQSALGRSMS